MTTAAPGSEPGPDAMVFGPPPPPPPRPRRARRKIGEVERGVRDDLARLPGTLRTGALAKMAIRLAMVIDANVLTGRDEAGHVRELRLIMVTIDAMAPGETRGDSTDAGKGARESRLTLLAGGAGE